MGLPINRWLTAWASAALSAIPISACGWGWVDRIIPSAFLTIPYGM